MAYVNPLDRFSSHSVHYVILACRSTEDIRSFTDTSQRAQSESLQAIDAAKTLGSPVKTRDGANSVFLLMDTRRFAQFTIDNFMLETLISGLTVPGSNSPNGVGIKMSFNVLDSVGISFANFLQFMMDKQLQVSFNGMTVLVRLLFVGHNEDGTSSTIQSMTIPAIFDKIQVDLNDTKGTYACELFPLVGMPSNAQYNAKWTSIGTASSYFTGAGDNSLPAVINAFETKLNEQSLIRFAKMNGEVLQAGQPAKLVGKYGRPVQYMITIPESWKKFKFTGPSQHGATEISFKDVIAGAEATKAGSAAEAQKRAQQNASAPGKDSHVAVDPSLTITEVLDVIFSQTIEVAQLGNFTKQRDQNGDLKFYKHLVTVTSDDTSFTVHVDVVEFMVPNVELNRTPAEANKATVSERDQLLFREDVDPVLGKRKLPKNFIELNYIFSGRNLDVLSLDLKIENLNWLLLRGTKLGGQALFSVADEGQKTKDGEAQGEDRRNVEGMRQKDPALPPQRNSDEARNFSSIAANAKTDAKTTPQEVNQQYKANLSAFYNAGPVVAKLSLRGNPNLLVGVSLGAIPQHVSAITVTDGGGTISAISSKTKDDYRKKFEQNVLKLSPTSPAPKGAVSTDLLGGPSFVSTPLFVKVNVFGPNVNFITNELIAGQDFAQELFYDNFYWCGKIVSKIEGTRFTHELDLTSYSVFGYSTAAAQGGKLSPVRDVR